MGSDVVMNTWHVSSNTDLRAELSKSYQIYEGMINSIGTFQGHYISASILSCNLLVWVS